LNRKPLVIGNEKQSRSPSESRIQSASKPAHSKDLRSENLSHGRGLPLLWDDTILRKVGKSISGTAYRKDPLGPPFNVARKKAPWSCVFKTDICRHEKRKRSRPVVLQVVVDEVLRDQATPVEGERLRKWLGEVEEGSWKLPLRVLQRRSFIDDW